MSEAATGEHTEIASAIGDDRNPSRFPLPRSRGVTWLSARSRPVRVLASSSPAFRLLMFGSSVSMLGTRISTVAFPMLVLHINNSPLITGLVSFAVIAPCMLFYMPAGVLIDHCNPRRVMLVSESLRGLAAFSVVGTLLMRGPGISIAFLILAMVAEEIFEIFSTLAERRYLNRVMEGDKVDSRQASIEARTHAAVLAGRPIGPLLFSIRAYLPFLADALSFIASVLSLFLVKKIDEPRVETPLRLSEVIRGIGEGFKWLIDRRRAWLTVLLMSMTSMVAQALILIFLVEAHSNQFSTAAISVVLAASGVGGAVGSFCSRIVPAAVRSFWLPIQMAVWAAAFSGLVLVGGNSVYLSATTMFVMSLTGAIGNVEFGTYLVRNIADDMIAKVTGISQTAAIGIAALGPVLGGSAIERFQVQGAVRILLVMMMLMAIASLLLPGTCRQIMRVIESFNPFVSRVPPANPGALGNVPDAASYHDRNSERIAVWLGNRFLMKMK